MTALPAAAAPPVPLSPTETLGRVAELSSAATQLCALLEQETALVRALRVKDIAPLQGEKTRLTKIFQTGLKALGAFDGKLLPEQVKLRWLTAARALAQAAVENERALRIARTATDRVVASIVAAVRATRRPTSGYTARRAAPRQIPLSGISLDRRL